MTGNYLRRGLNINETDKERRSMQNIYNNTIIYLQGLIMENSRHIVRYEYWYFLNFYS